MAGGKAPGRKGAEAEAEVVRLWRANGWPRARRQPGSGSWRPYGARDASPMPLDVGAVDPFLVSVKRDKRLARPQIGTRLPGAAFARRAIRELLQVVERRPVGTVSIPVLFGRPGLGEGQNGWRVWLPELALYGWLRDAGQVLWAGDMSNFVEIPWWAFFPLIGTEEAWAS